MYLGKLGALITNMQLNFMYHVQSALFIQPLTANLQTLKWYNQGCGVGVEVGVGVARSRGNEPGVGVGVDQGGSTPTPGHLLQFDPVRTCQK